ncbi:Crp/Fnr family transcriptional regulator [Streptomyces pluripotens]|uniref:Crp/Fnr family transcriptional regulator n=1 Tax=Streptomyces pluripotens TaxID=1355015 RepID=A0A221P8C1_9ACTN|nr:cyclic nucleotide-binding protein [Streptomyces pluripotens]ASN28457.1 Crp/Fnr family transcriptional regulator [Streptomyces pluripotens]KIE26058.1 cyclic nucleotide-binding protein [Streptomyces sp. MUSC 125]
MPYCLTEDADALAAPAWGAAPPPWAPGRREETDRMTDREDDTGTPGRTWCISEVDIFRDLSEAEMDAIAAAAPMKTYAAGEMLHSPQQPGEVLFILKRGRVRIFRVAADGRALTTAIISPGTIFGEMALLGQRMYDNFAEALDGVTVCVMSRADVQRFLLSDARIAARITEILGRRLADLEQRLSDSVFKSVPQRIATTLATLATRNDTPAARLRPGVRHPQISLTHEQLAALAGTSRETCTKVLRDFADRGLLRLARGRITVLDLPRLTDAAG